MTRRPPRSPLFPYPPLFRSAQATAQVFPTARHPAALNRAALATALAAVLLAGCASRPAPAPVTVPPSMPAPTAPVAPVQPEPATAPDAAQQEIGRASCRERV